MKLDPNNDVYQGDLALLRRRKDAWAKGSNQGKIFRTLSYATLFVGLGVMLYIAFNVADDGTMKTRLPLHFSIWGTALIAYLLMKHARQISETPFTKYHAARFEADNKALYYICQQGLALKTYMIKDKNLKSIVRDDEAGALYIKGKGIINTVKRNGETNEDVESFYALVPFDKYDLDDLLEPYKNYVTNGDGTLRNQYLQEKS